MIELIKHELGKISKVIDWGVTTQTFPTSFIVYKDWVQRQSHKPLDYLEGERFEARRDIKNIFPWAKTVLVCLFSYQAEKKSSEQEQMAGYVYGFDGVDYHHYIKEKLTPLKLAIEKEGHQAEIIVDTMPVLERDFAYQAGLGWFGKNSMMISQDHGSYFMLGLMALSEYIPNDRKREMDHCGSCRRCIDACPTNAIIPGMHTIETSKCISTYTIELFKNEVAPPGYQDTDYLYGCDICQEVCPWNNKALKEKETVELPSIASFFQTPRLIDLLGDQSNREFRRKMQGTPLERTGRIGVMKNIINKLKS